MFAAYSTAYIENYDDERLVRSRAHRQQVRLWKCVHTIRRQQRRVNKARLSETRTKGNIGK